MKILKNKMHDFYIKIYRNSVIFMSTLSHWIKEWMIHTL